MGRGPSWAAANTPATASAATDDTSRYFIVVAMMAGGFRGRQVGRWAAEGSAAEDADRFDSGPRITRKDADRFDITATEDAEQRGATHLHGRGGRGNTRTGRRRISHMIHAADLQILNSDVLWSARFARFR